MTEKRLYIGSLGPSFYDDTDAYPTPQDAGDQGFGDGVLMNTMVTNGAILAASFKLWDTDTTHTLELKWNEDDSANRILNFLVVGGNRSLTLNENFIIGGGYDVTITALGQANTLTLNESLTIGDGNSGTITFGNASDVLTINETLTLAGASGKVLTLNENLTIGDGTDITITGVTQANTLTLHESLTIGNGNDGTITFSAASKIVTVAGSCTLNDWFDQAVKAASNVGFGTIGCGTITSSGNLIIADAGNIGSATTTNALAIASNGDVTFLEDIVFSHDKGFRMGTSDGADDEAFYICGGGSFSYTRGAYAIFTGNEATGHLGDLILQAGNVSTGDILFRTAAGQTRMTIDNAGKVGIGGVPHASYEVNITGGSYNGLRTVVTLASGTVYGGVFSAGGASTKNMGCYATAAGASTNHHFEDSAGNYSAASEWFNASHSSRKTLIQSLDDLSMLYAQLDKLSIKSFRNKAEIPVLGYSEVEVVINDLGMESPVPILDDSSKAPERFGLMADDPDLPDFLCSQDRQGLGGGSLANYALICIKHQKTIINQLEQRIATLEAEA